MCSPKALLFISAVLSMVFIANADMTLTVNGLDTAKPIEIEDSDRIIISVTDQVDEQSYFLMCTLGGKLTPLSDSNTSELQETVEGYLFTFDDEETSLATVGLMVGEVSDYQLVLFKILNANIVIFGIDSDAVQIESEPASEQQAQPEQQPCDSQTYGFDVLSAGDCNEILDPNWYPNLNDDSSVNFEDFAILATDWLQSGDALDGDINTSKKVDLDDLAILTYYWLANACGPSPEEVFESFKTALTIGNVNEALSFVAEVSRDRYAEIFQIIEPNLPDYVAGMGPLTLESEDGGTAKYEMRHQAGSETYFFPVIFIRDENGTWRIYNF